MTQASLFGIHPEQLSKVVHILKNFSGVNRGVIFGSRALGTFRPGSDIDIAVEGSTLTHDDLLRLSSLLDDLMLPYKIDLVFLHQIDNPNLLDHIQRVGREIF